MTFCVLTYFILTYSDIFACVWVKTMPYVWDVQKPGLWGFSADSYKSNPQWYREDGALHRSSTQPLAHPSSLEGRCPVCRLRVLAVQDQAGCPGGQGDDRSCCSSELFWRWTVWLTWNVEAADVLSEMFHGQVPTTHWVPCRISRCERTSARRSAACCIRSCFCVYTITI